MNIFYPEIEPFNSGSLRVSPLHTVYFEEVGNPKGTPVVFLHGGPGAGISPDHRRYFDPKFFRIVLFDQRGCGKSTPFAELTENTTWDLVSDIEKIREHLKIEQWHVFGGSWGSTLALSYGCKHPNRILSFVLRGIFLCRPSEIHWFYQDGASQIFPDEWDKYRDHIPEGERNNFVKAYYKRLTDPDLKVRSAAARVWSQWESATAYLYQNKKAVDNYEDDTLALPFARIECHYFMNNSFFSSDNFLLENIEKFKHIPAKIVQGRYDIVCPARSAWELHKIWPKSVLEIIVDAGHSASEPGIRSALIQATNSIRDTGKPC